MSITLASYTREAILKCDINAQSIQTRMYLPSILEPCFDLCLGQTEVLREFHSFTDAQVLVLLQYKQNSLYSTVQNYATVCSF